MEKRDYVEAIKTLKSRIVVHLVPKKHGLRVQLERLPGPENGPKRHELRMEYNWHVRPVIRATLLAYGILRGRKYRQIEQKAERAPEVYTIMKTLHELNEGFKAEWPIERIQAWVNPVDAYVRLWKKIDALNDRGLNDSPEADTLREESEFPWSQMSDEQKEEADVLILKHVEWKKQVAA